MLKAFRYRLNPTKAQEAVLNEQLWLCRNLYNCALQERRDAYKKAGKTITGYDQMKYLTEIKEALPEYKGVYSQVLQDVLKRLDRAYQAFFRRVKAGQKAGFPRFQGRGRFDSLCYPQSGFTVSDKTAYFSKIGNVRTRLHRPLEGKIKTATIRRECGEWCVSYVCEVEAQPLPAGGQLGRRGRGNDVVCDHLRWGVRGESQVFSGSHEEIAGGAAFGGPQDQQAQQQAAHGCSAGRKAAPQGESSAVGFPPQNGGQAGQRKRPDCSRRFERRRHGARQSGPQYPRRRLVAVLFAPLPEGRMRRQESCAGRSSVYLSGLRAGTSANRTGSASRALCASSAVIRRTPI